MLNHAWKKSSDKKEMNNLNKYIDPWAEKSQEKEEIIKLNICVDPRYNVINVLTLGWRGRAGNHTRMASRPQFPFKTVFAALHFTCMFSVPHLSALLLLTLINLDLKYYINSLLATSHSENKYIIDFYNFKIRIQSQFNELNPFLFLAFFLQSHTQTFVIFLKIELF